MANPAPREQRALYSDLDQHADHGLPELVINVTGLRTLGGIPGARRALDELGR